MTDKMLALFYFIFLQNFFCVCVYLFFFPIIFISWKLITLQYDSGFCHTLTWISHGFTCVPLFYFHFFHSTLKNHVIEYNLCTLNCIYLKYTICHVLTNVYMT